MVKGTVEKTLNAMQDAEADAMCNAHAMNTHQSSWIQGWELLSEYAYANSGS